MTQAMQIFLELLPHGGLTIELAMLALGVLFLKQLSAIVRESLEDRFPFPKIAGYVGAFFGVFLPAAIVIWFVSIVLRYALSF